MLNPPELFLSTPSARRATVLGVGVVIGAHGFLSTPSARRATTVSSLYRSSGLISIHALREEGDAHAAVRIDRLLRFLSTPSARRATYEALSYFSMSFNFYPRPPRGGRPKDFVNNGGCLNISIHALREEGDHVGIACRLIPCHFYPRPPRGGRPEIYPLTGE